MRPCRTRWALATTAVILALPNLSSQHYYRDQGRYGYGRSNYNGDEARRYYDYYYKLTHNKLPGGANYYGYPYSSGGYYPRDPYGRSYDDLGGRAGGGAKSYYPNNYNYWNYPTPSKSGYGGGYPYGGGGGPGAYYGYGYGAGGYGAGGYGAGGYGAGGYGAGGYGAGGYGAGGGAYRYYDNFYKGRSYDVPPGGYYGYDKGGYYYGRPPYGDNYDNYRRYPLTPGWGGYNYFYGRSFRDQKPPAKNVDPFPGKFLGFGSVRYTKGGRDIELHCNLSKDGNKVVSNIVWVKVENAYRQTPYGGPSGFPSSNPYFCPTGGCIYKDVDISDPRYIADMHGEVATLHIFDVQPRDYGIYRCSATAEATNRSPGDTESSYQIVEFLN